MIMLRASRNGYSAGDLYLSFERVLMISTRPILAFEIELYEPIRDMRARDEVRSGECNVIRRY